MSGTVVLCGSLGATAAMWDGQRAALAGLGLRIVDVEHPGHGAAPVTEARAIAALADRVLAAVEGAFSFVGLSLGGAIGMRIAADHPDRVERLVLACTAERFGEPAAWHERAALVRAEGTAAVVDAVLARWFTPDFPDRDRFRALYLSIDREGYARCCEALAGWEGEGLERIAAPTLVVAGSEDPTAPPEAAEAIAARISGARVRVLAGAAHVANIEQPEAFNELLEDHLR